MRIPVWYNPESGNLVLTYANGRSLIAVIYSTIDDIYVMHNYVYVRRPMDDGYYVLSPILALLAAQTNHLSLFVGPEKRGFKFSSTPIVRELPDDSIMDHRVLVIDEPHLFTPAVAQAVTEGLEAEGAFRLYTEHSIEVEDEPA